MKFNHILLILSIILSFKNSFAASYVCSQGKTERKITVTYSGGNKTPPCEVKYQKEGEAEGTVKWSAKAESDYCEKKSDAFAEKLKGMGWTCTAQK